MLSRRRRWMLGLMLMSAVCASSGCDVSLGPKTKTEIVIAHAGRPIQILENVKAKGRVLDGSGDTVVMDLGGGVWMPQDHWDTVKRQLERLAVLEKK